MKEDKLCDAAQAMAYKLNFHTANRLCTCYWKVETTAVWPVDHIGAHKHDLRERKYTHVT